MLGWPPSTECSCLILQQTSSAHWKPDWTTHTPWSCTFSSCFLRHSAICWAIKIITTDNLSAYEKLPLGKRLAAQREERWPMEQLPSHGSVCPNIAISEPPSAWLTSDTSQHLQRRTGHAAEIQTVCWRARLIPNPKLFSSFLLNVLSTEHCVTTEPVQGEVHSQEGRGQAK